VTGKTLGAFIPGAIGVRAVGDGNDTGGAVSSYVHGLNVPGEIKDRVTVSLSCSE